MIRGLRESVHLTSRETLRMFHLADIWAARTHTDVRLVSANDHVHARRSAHYDGLALDFHASDPDHFAEMMRREGYRVLWKVPGHYGHIHVEAPRTRMPADRAVVRAARRAAVRPVPPRPATRVTPAAAAPAPPRRTTPP